MILDLPLAGPHGAATRLMEVASGGADFGYGIINTELSFG